MFILQVQSRIKDDPLKIAIAADNKAAEKATAKETETKVKEGSNKSDQSWGDFFYSNSKGSLKYGIEIAAPGTAAIKYASQMEKVANTWRSLNKASSPARAFATHSPNGTALGRTFFGKAAAWCSRFPGFARAAEWLTKATSLTSKIPGVTMLATKLGGRVLPGIGALLAVGDCIKDWNSYRKITKKDNESDQDYKNRCDTAKNDAIINTSCTATGAAIGAVIGSVIPGAGTILGALIGAGIGNLVGSLAKSDGWGRPICNGLLEVGKFGLNLLGF